MVPRRVDAADSSCRGAAATGRTREHRGHVSDVHTPGDHQSSPTNHNITLKALTDLHTFFLALVRDAPIASLNRPTLVDLCASSPPTRLFSWPSMRANSQTRLNYIGR